jgi:hypothetical protein
LGFLEKEFQVGAVAGTKGNILAKVLAGGLGKGIVSF